MDNNIKDNMESMDQNNIGNCDNDDLGELQNVRQRPATVFQPLDNFLSTSPLMNCTLPVSLTALIDLSRQQIPCNSRINPQLLCIISNYNANGSTTTFGAFCVYSHGYHGSAVNQQSVNYTHLFLCKVVEGQENNALVCLMKASSKNR
eukprot:7627854-Ditylum_brightwellii.AAC.1